MDEVLDFKLDFDTSPADRTISEYGKKIAKAFKSSGGEDPLKTLKKDIQITEKNIDELSKKIKELGEEKVEILGEDAKKHIAEYEAQLAKLEQEASTMEPYLVYDENTIAQMNAVDKAIDEISSKMDKLELDNGEVSDAEAYSQLRAQLEELNNQRKELENNGIMGFTEEDKVRIAELNDGIEELQNKIIETEKAGTELIPADNAAKIAELKTALADEKKTLKALEDGYKNLSEEQNNNTKVARENQDVHSKSSGIFGMSLSRLVGYALGIRSLYTVFSKLKAAAKEGLRYIANASPALKSSIDSMTNSFTQMKAATGAAIAPLVQALAPVIIKIANLFTIAANAVTRFFAILTGKNTVIQAVTNQNKFAKAVGGSGKAAKKAGEDVRKALAPFDDLNVLADEAADNLDDMSGGGGAGGLDMSAFETVNLDNFDSPFLKSFKEWVDNLNLEPLIEAWNKFTDVISRFFEVLSKAGMWVWENLLAPLGKWLIESTIPLILESIAYAIEVVLDVLEELGPIIDAVWKVLEPLFTWLGDVVTSVLTTIRDTLQNLHEWFEQNKGTPEAQAMAGTLVLAGTLIITLLSLLKDSFKKTKDEAEKTKDPIQQVSDKFDTFFKTLDKIGTIVAIAFLLGQLAQVIQSLTGLIEAMNDAGMTFWDVAGLLLAILVPLGLAIAALVAFIPLGAGLKLLIIGEAINLIANGVATLLEAITNLISTPAKSLKELIELLEKKGRDTVAKIKDISTEYRKTTNLMKEDTSQLKTSIQQHLNDLDKSISELKDKLQKYLKSIKEDIVKYITGSSGESVKYLLNDFRKWIENDMFGKIESRFPTFQNNFRSMLNTMIGYLQKFADAAASAADAVAASINNLSVDIPSWVPQYGGYSWNPHLSGGVRTSLPKLATGAVLPPNQPFLAMLGDQKKGTNIEAPLDTIVEAMQQALSSMNYNGGQEIVLNIDGTALARLTVPNTLNELNRQGYNVKVLENKGR